MAVNKDFEDLLHALNQEKAKFLVVGAHAVICYTEPRFTKDLDIWIQTKTDNAKKVFNALQTFGAPLKNLTYEDFLKGDMVFQIGMDPNRIDILMGVEALDFDKAWKNKKSSKYGKEKIYILSVNDLIKNKKKLGRLQDKLDLERLKKFLKN